jgi:2'-5' RNA ligase
MDEGRSARVFLAIGVSAKVAGLIDELVQAIRRDAPAGLFRFVEASQGHVTLRFLGQRSSEEQTRIVRAATAAAQGASPFAMALGGLGVFPDDRRPHTLWIGLKEGASELTALAARLDAELARAGFRSEGRPYVPHLTLARIKRRPPRDLMKKLLGGELDGGPVAREGTAPREVVDRFALMESRATGATVRYVSLQIFRLETACTPSK